MKGSGMPFSGIFHKDTTVAKKACSGVRKNVQTAECGQKLHELALGSCHEQCGLELPCHLLEQRIGDIERQKREQLTPLCVLIGDNSYQYSTVCRVM